MKKKNKDKTVIVNICLQASSLTISSFFFYFGQIQFLPKFLIYDSSDGAAKLHLFD